MYDFAILLHMVAIILVIVFVILFLLGKKKGKDVSKKKMGMIISIVVWIASLIMAVILAPEPSEKEDKAETTAVESNETVEKVDVPTETSEVPGLESDEGGETEALRNELKEKYDVTEPSKFVKGDTTGRWRIVKVANATAPAEYALDYAKVYMKDAESTDIHYIVNFSLKTTTKLQVVLGKLLVTTTEYVDKEEHDATIIGEGLLLTEEAYDLESGEKITADADPAAGTVNSEDLIAEVKAATADQVGENEKITDISFDGSDLYLKVDVSNTEIKIAGFTKKDVAISRIESITDAILDLDDKYMNTWQTITVDFGEEGKATFDKSQVKDEGFGRYFEVPADVLD